MRHKSVADMKRVMCVVFWSTKIRFVNTFSEMTKG